ncbi:MAG: peptidase [Leptolyngbya sp. PLA3]|nr:MAG: peptidase [Cyanobacteria bacterium CYA]MCE7969766.1 peptidase [Leptolyngbya sp. PL-A3]
MHQFASLVVAMCVACVVFGQELVYDAAFFPGAAHDPAIDTPEKILGFAMGDRPTTHAEIEKCLKRWDEQSERALLVSHGQTHEGRTLYHIIISSPRNMARIEQIKKDLATLGNPRGLSEAAGKALLDRTPATAWMAYSIHGDELSGADAGLALAWHYIACTDQSVLDLLDQTVVIIDPLMNPDGRDRYLAQLREFRGAVPSVDDQARLHGGRWPWGRTNHYLFDMNRDWIFGMCPETRGRIAAAGPWQPMLFVDAHEMDTQDTYLFTPSREPINPNYTAFQKRWLDEFAGDHAGAFDAQGWRYYTGEWADDWYPGYSNAWASFRGGIGILYEQAGVDWFGVRRAAGNVLTYRQSVHQQLLSSLANVRTLFENRAEIKQGWLAGRRACVSSDGAYARRVFAVVPGANPSRVDAFLDAMRLQGFETYLLGSEWSGPGVDRLGRAHESVSLPAGTIVIPNAQPNANLLAAMLEFDPRMNEAFLAEERRDLIRNGQTWMYDVTGWSLPMLYDLEAYELDTALPDGVKPLVEIERAEPGLRRRDAGQGWVIDGADDAVPALAMKLMLAGVRVRLADEAFTWGERGFARGSIVITREDNPRGSAEWIDTLDRLCREAQLAAEPIATGLGAGDVADIGGEHFDLLATPRIAVLSESPVDSGDFGSIWYTLDERYQLPATHLPCASLSYADLRRYNVLIAPGGAGELLADATDKLRTWIESGGTLIAIGSSGFEIAQEGGLSSARALEDVLGALDEYEIAVLREWAADAEVFDAETVWSHGVLSGKPAYPWDDIDLDRGSEEELTRRDDWQRQFMPPGTVLATRTDDEHWLTVGCGPDLPILFSSTGVLMAKDEVEAPIRYGVLEDDATADEPRRAGWCTIPAGKELRLRMSGLLWPEAAHRIANSAAVTREGVGRGQIILFADPPTFRAASLGTTRVFLNAVVYGPGMGASAPILEP